jgi:hypothetical protein
MVSALSRETCHVLLHQLPRLQLSSAQTFLFPLTSLHLSTPMM